MSDQLTLFPLDEYYQNPLNEKIWFYIEVEILGQWYFVWKPHQEHDELEKLEIKGDTRKRPFRWLTTSGAYGYAVKKYGHYQFKVKNYIESEWENEQ